MGRSLLDLVATRKPAVAKPALDLDHIRQAISTSQLIECDAGDVSQLVCPLHLVVDKPLHHLQKLALGEITLAAHIPFTKQINRCDAMLKEPSC